MPGYEVDALKVTKIYICHSLAVLPLPQSYLVKPFATIPKNLPRPCRHWLTGGGHLIPLHAVHF